MDILQTIQDNYKGHSFALIKTKKLKPFGYIGYMLTIYDKKDDTTIIVDLKAKTLKKLQAEIYENR